MEKEERQERLLESMFIMILMDKDGMGQRMKEQESGFRNSINAIYRGNGEIMCIVLSVREIVGMEPPVFIELNN